MQDDEITSAELDDLLDQAETVDAARPAAKPRCACTWQLIRKRCTSSNSGQRHGEHISTLSQPARYGPARAQPEPPKARPPATAARQGSRHRARTEIMRALPRGQVRLMP